MSRCKRLFNFCKLLLKRVLILIILLKLKIVEDDIVKLRQTTEVNAQNEKISVEDLHLLLVVAR
jgi:hypothetical protein